MRSLIYDVAVTADGFICDAIGNADMFPADGPHVAAYVQRLQSYGTVIMGRATYEFGYRFGLKPGARAYPHMDHHIFSSQLVVPDDGDITVVRDGWLQAVNALKATEGAPIYLCGGGRFAGFLVGHGCVDILRLKCAPVVIGAGVPLFGGAAVAGFTQTDQQTYDNGVVYRQLERH